MISLGDSKTAFLLLFHSFLFAKATIVDGVPRIIIPAVYFGNGGTCPVTCADHDNWHCPLITPAMKEACAMTYTYLTPLPQHPPLLHHPATPICALA